jgi:hypothetical protein
VALWPQILNLKDKSSALLQISNLHFHAKFYKNRSAVSKFKMRYPLKDIQKKKWIFYEPTYVPYLYRKVGQKLEVDWSQTSKEKSTDIL